jgi:hypothetical protein
MPFKNDAQRKAVMAKLKGYRTIIYNPEGETVMAKLKGYRTIIYNPEGEIVQIHYKKTKKEAIKPVIELNKDLGFKLSPLTKYPSKQAIHYGGGYTIRKVYN